MQRLFLISALLSATAVAGPTKQGQVIDLPVINDNTYSFIPIKIGTPAETRRLLFDTGSSSPWVYSTNCTSEACPNASGYRRHEYNLTASTTGMIDSTRSNISYLGGGISGPIVTDIFDVGDIAIHQPFIDANQSSWAGLTGDGFVGFGFDKLAPPGLSTMISTLFKTGSLAKPQFAIWYGKQGSGAQNFSDGVFTIGGDHAERYVDGPISDIPIVKQEYEGVNDYFLWRSELMQMNITTTQNGSAQWNTESFAGTGNNTVFDTGAGQILLADYALDGLYESLGFNYTKILDGEEYMPCSAFNSSWSVEFTFLGYNSVTLYGDELAQPGFPAAPDACFPPFSSSGSDLNLIGTPFLQQLYSVWDFGSFNSSEYNPRLRLGRLRKD